MARRLHHVLVGHAGRPWHEVHYDADGLAVALRAQHRAGHELPSIAPELPMPPGAEAGSGGRIKALLGALIEGQQRREAHVGELAEQASWWRGVRVCM